MEEDKKTEMLNFIMKNESLIDIYDVTNLYHKALMKKFHVETGFYICELHNSEIGIESIGFRTKCSRYDFISYSELIKRFNKFVSGSHWTLEELRIKYTFHSLFKHYYFRINSISESGITYAHISGNSIDSLFNFLKFIIKGEINENLGYAMGLMAKYKIEYDQPFPYTKIDELGGIKITRLKNDDVKIKGLILSDIDRIVEITNFYDKE